MVTNVKVEDRLDGVSNFNSWKSRVLIVLKENDLLEFVEVDISKPIEDLKKIQWKKNGTKARKIMIDSVKDHLVPIISKMKTAKETFDALKGLYEINNISRALALRQQLHHIKLTKGDSNASFFIKISDLRDQLSTIGDTIANRDLAMLALNGLPNLGNHSFIASVGDPSCQSLIVYELIVFRRKLDWQQEEMGEAPIMKKVKFLLYMLLEKREKEKEEKEAPSREIKTDFVLESRKKDLSNIQCY
ncbi:uncharacterized protein LOC131876659 [Cryptomeria japonica]|uniref:uncharacterized protein LOC131876659 n=1 Tax=Cryptomeria japonica TaxID=3369 RepID=UPI0027DA5A75|nr:uncharacterized protein LOC131876659 [Cryptomeria japonica]